VTVLLVLAAGALTMLTRLDAGDLRFDGVLYAQVARASGMRASGSSPASSSRPRRRSSRVP